MKNDLPLLNEPSDDALFRYQVLSQVLVREQTGEPRSAAIAGVAAGEHITADRKLRKVSQRSIYRWLAAYQSQGFAGLLPAARPHIEGSVVLPQPLIDYFKNQKTADPWASVPELIRRAAITGLITPDQLINRVTVWRTLKRMGIDTRRGKKPVDRDSRRFAYPHRMQMVICDGKHFRTGAARLRRVALFFLDDATRMGLHVVVGTSENAELFMRGLYETMLCYGMIDALYVDRGPGFVATDVIEVLRKLEILYIRGTAGYPQGHGKIERFNRTVKAQVLRHLDGNPEIDTHCGALELRLAHYLRNQYNLTPHESLGQQAPGACFYDDKKPLRFAQSQHHLRQAFILHTKRRVSNDNVLSIDGVFYEVIRGHAQSKVMVHRNVLEGSVAILHQGRLVRLSPVDLHKNARQKRAKSQWLDKKEDKSPLTKGSAQMAFERDMRPIIDTDGGFAGPEKNLKEDES
jgi:transposase InsO family protein